MDSQLFTSTFKRLNNDIIPELADNMSYDMALNAVKKAIRGKGFGLVNEGSTDKILSFAEDMVGAVHVETRDWFVILLKNGEFGFFNIIDRSYKAIYNLNDLNKESDDGCGNISPTEGCSFDFSCEWVNLEYNFWNQCNELHVMFSYNCTFYTVNIDELADEKRRAHVKCSDVLTFKCDGIPVTRAIGREGGGMGLPNGIYRFVTMLKDKDGHKTNYFDIGNAVSVGGGKNKPGELSNQYIQFNIEKLSCRYGTVDIVVVKKIGGQISCFLVDSKGYSSNGVSFEYRGDNGREIPVPLEEILIKKVNYLKGRALKSFDNRMFYYQIKNEKNINIQSIANSLNISLPIYRIPSTEAHKYSGLQPLERYIFSINGRYCDGTKTRGGVITGGGTLEQRTSGFDGDDDYNENPGTVTDTGGSGGSGGGSGSGSVTYNAGDKDSYKAYKDLPPDDRRVLADSYYDKDGNPAIKKHIEEIDGLKDAVENGPQGKDCAECGMDAVRSLGEAITGDEDGSGGGAPCPNLEGKTVLSDAEYAILVGQNPQAVLHYINQSTYDDLAAACEGSDTTATKPYKKIMEDLKEELENEPVWTPKRVEVNVNNGKTQVKSGTFNYNKDGTYGEQYDGINIYKVGEMSPKWVESTDTYPKTRDCSGGFIYEAMAGKPIMMVEIPPIKFFDSNSVGVQSSKTMGVDETAGFVYMVGLRVTNLPDVKSIDSGKPLVDWEIGYIPRTAFNSRVIGSGILIDTFEGEANGRVHAVPKHGVNADEYLDRYIERGGDVKDHEGQASSSNLHTFISPDCLLGKVPLVANKFIKTYDLTGDGWRHGLYAESTKDVGYFGRNKDNRGYRGTVSLHSGTAAYAEADILGISYAKGDSVIEPPPGIEVPLLNLNRETSVYLKLSSAIGKNTDSSFRADGEDHYGPIVSARAAYGHLIREIPNQYGSVVNARFAPIGLYSNGSSRSVEGLVGDSHVGSFNIRRTSYISNRVGDRTFIPSPRHYSNIARFFGFGDPTEPPDNGDKKDPKNLANRYPGQGIMEASGGGGTGSVYYPGVAKTLLFFFCQSRVNTYYRQRGDEEGQVHARNLGKLSLDASIPKGVRWEEAWLPRFYREIHRASKFALTVVPAARIGIIIGLPLFVLIAYVIKVNTVWDVFPSIARLVLYLATYIVAILVLTPSRLFRMLGVKDYLKDSEGGADDEDLRQWEDNYCEYNSDYNEEAITSIYGIPDPYNVCDCDDCSESTYYRPGEVPTKGINNLIYYTPKQYQGTEINAFKNVLEGNYSDMGTESGQLQRLFSLNNMLYAITTDGIWRLSYQSNGDANYRDLDYLLGNGMALGTPHRIGEGIEEGFRGTVDPNSFIVTPFGASWIDYKNRSVVLFNGGSARVISDDGVSDLMFKYMPFCNGDMCRDQKYGTGVWFSLGYDPDLGRLMVTKKDGAGGGSWTLSYDFQEKVWISAHSYVPNVYLWDRNTMYSIFNKTLWKHNSESSKQVFYGKYYPYKVWFYSANLRNLADHAAPMQLSSIEIHTIADEIGGAMNRDITFTMGGWNNSYQMTGLYLLDTRYYQCAEHKDIRDKGFATELYRVNPGLWRFNELVDNIKTKENAILKYEDCSFFVEYTDNADCRGGDGQKSVMADYYLRHCLIFHDESKSKVELKLLRVIGYGKKQEA